LTPSPAQLEDTNKKYFHC